MNTSSSTVTNGTLIKIGFLGLAFTAGAVLLWQASGLILLMFAGMLLALLLDTTGRWLEARLPLSRAVCLLLTTSSFMAITTLGLWFTGPDLIAQATKLAEDLPQSMKTVERWMMSIDAVEETVESASIDLIKFLPSPGGFLGGVTSILGTTFGVLANLVLFLFFGIYMAIEPDIYTQGAIRLLPVDRRQSARDVLGDMASTLRQWLAGKALMMLLLGIISYAGLKLIGIPLALLLAVIAGVTSFVPIIGPAIAGVLMILVAMTVSWQLALWTIGFYVALQIVESYLLLPLIQAKAIALPAALVIAAQVLMGLLFGALGVALATPIAAVGAVAVKRLYVEDILERDDKKPSSAQPG